MKLEVAEFISWWEVYVDCEISCTVSSDKLAGDSRQLLVNIRDGLMDRNLVISDTDLYWS